MPSEDFSSNGAVLPLSESLNVKGPSCRLHHDSGLDSDTANQGSSPPTALLIHTQDSTLDDSLTLSRVHCEIKNREAPPQEGLGPLPKTTLPYIPDSNDQDGSRSAHLINFLWLLFVKVIDLPQDKSVNYTLHQGGYGSLQFLSSTSSSLSQTLYELTSRTRQRQLTKTLDVWLNCKKRKKELVTRPGEQGGGRGGGRRRSLGV